MLRNLLLLNVRLWGETGKMQFYIQFYLTIVGMG